MFGMIWRLLPGDHWAKAGQAVLLVVVVASLLWFVVFPWLDPLLPTSDVTVGR
jgi:hypothetical protein